MVIIPAIDLKDGLCVRLLQGRKEDATVYSDDPVATARKWESYGAKLLHVVDLDGAFTGNQKNFESIRKIRESISMDIEVGGGIRDIDRIDKLVSLGINRVILGTVAIENPGLVKEACRKYPGRVVIGIDAKNGLVAVKGWVEVTQVRARDLALQMQGHGAAGIIYTDISKDGMMTGPNIEATREMAEALDIPVIASGGVSSIDDIKRLLGIKGLWGAITGKAIYSGSLDLKSAIELTMRNA
ncbi:MAG: 1-(5-phosphoribosyl)-5-[(5-phosphoribosylamino)methylideneamino]imidazole-4-carboxamide isomerase [Nitrospirae bacterium]|nr:1-(5-phosphoribosyl)-5-[(5-phosphoribosylamino)methylideneamino]imidazole-4-carboxamide isomerase [Nitrospirota bacterium]MCL5236557.1 1-(5-phosphoribosyl)-5-[(5-phosphoribosylamino)methylideneamino]imidazole-4-carboxamide isomerase [Nitrospirota bacterium]